MIPLEKAIRFATQICEAIAPYCTKVEIAGSIRRRKPEVSDIDLVVLADDPAAVKARFSKTCTMRTNGDEIATFIHGKSQIQIDVFFASAPIQELFLTLPTNYGSILLCRTGSKEHNIYLVELARSLGKIWRPNAGLIGTDGQMEACETELSIFKALNLEYIEPEQRER